MRNAINMRLRSLLFVPADRPERFAKAVASGTDAIILDLEDSVAGPNKKTARNATIDFLKSSHACVTLVRINSLDSVHIEDDLTAILDVKPDGIVLPKAEGAASLDKLFKMMQNAHVPVLPIATETPAAMFELGTYSKHADRLLGLTWGAEDLPAALGATAARDADGCFTPLLCHLNFGSFAVRVYGLMHPWLDEELWHEGIEVHGRPEGVCYQARGGRYASG